MMPFRLDAGLPAEAVDALNAFWRRLAFSGAQSVEREDIRHVARVVAGAARTSSLLPEHLVVMIKESWHGHPSLREQQERLATEWAMTEMVSLCICEFFAAASAAPDAARAGCVPPISDTRPPGGGKAPCPPAL